ncbi:histidine kinase [Bacillus luti]|uniref:histidine kinase n=1 Tax=Bacillus luti TaxID=2026191 RepID=A0A7V7V3H1_9BACI|nr:histidine kinase [Bacillus luti]KAB2439668.1 response regulator [Bacillus luti]
MWKQQVAWCLAVIAIVLITYISLKDSTKEYLEKEATNGLIDLSMLSKDKKIVSLNGEWRLIPNYFANPLFFQEKAINKNVFTSWNLNTQFATYQLKIILPEHFYEVGFRIRNIWSAHTIYINGERLSEVGKIGKSKKDTSPQNPSYEFYFKPKAKELLVTIHVANFYNARNGIVFPIDFGDAKTLKEAVQEDIGIEWIAISMLLIFSIFHLTIFLLRKEDDSYFYSGSYFFSLALMIMTRGERVLLRLIPNFPFEFYFRLQDSVTIFSSFFISVFLIKIVPSIMNKKQMLFTLAPIIIYTIAIILFPARTLSNFQTISFYYVNILLLGIISRIIWLIRNKEWIIPKNEIIILNFMLLFLFIFSYSGTIEQLFLSGRNIFNRLGLIGFIIMMNIFLAARLINRTQEAETLNTQLERANLAKESFIDITTQELKIPLYHAINLIKSVQIDVEKEKSLKRLYIVEQLMERLLYLTNDLQDFTKIRFQDYSFHIQSTNIRMIVCHIAKLMDYSFSKKKIVFRECISHNLYVLGDENRLGQVFYRILEECKKFSTNGKIIVYAKHTNDHVHITFKVTGKRTLIYKNQTSEVGLILAKELIKQMNGHLNVELLKNGIVIEVKLPFSEYRDSNSVLQYNSMCFSDLTIQHPQKILIVEDDVFHAAVLESLLSDSYTVINTYSAQEAVSILSQEDFTLVLIDELMPGIDGIELVRQIRKTASLIELPIVMMTLNNYPTNLDVFFAAGANDYIVKPVTKQVLLAKLNTVEKMNSSLKTAIENEMAFLQAQIKPHFLYNAFSSIISFCYTDGERAAHLLTMLSYYLRYILELGENGHALSLQKELEIIKAYVEIEKARFGKRLTISYEIDPSLNLNQIHIPSLLIQPLVENAIRHGIFEKEGNGHVQISIFRIKDSLLIQVKDDGIGMSDLKLKELLEKDNKHRGIGFANVLQRVHKISKGGLKIHSVEGQGTTMSIMIQLTEDNYVENDSYR